MDVCLSNDSCYEILLPQSLINNVTQNVSPEDDSSLLLKLCVLVCFKCSEDGRSSNI